MGSDELEKIYKLYYKELYIYTFSICKNYSLTEEIISDTFFKAFLSIDNCERYIKYLLMRICKNLIFDYYKKIRKEALNL